MSQTSPFDHDPDPELGSLIREHYSGPAPERFITRLSREMSRLPERDTEWDVLAGWARPGVLAAALAAGFLLGLTVWRGVRERTVSLSPSVASVAMLEEPRGATAGSVIATVLEVR